jgi:hypothetical protein
VPLPRRTQRAPHTRLVAGAFSCALSALLIVAISVPYYVWRREHPERARWLNKHAWMAIGINACLHPVLVHVLGWA